MNAFTKRLPEAGTLTLAQACRLTGISRTWLLRHAAAIGLTDGRVEVTNLQEWLERSGGPRANSTRYPAPYEPDPWLVEHGFAIPWTGENQQGGHE